MAKWNEPIGAAPSWLSKTTEVTASNDGPKPPVALFYPLLVDAQLRAGVPLWQAIAIAANTASEAGWEIKGRANNYTGVKITKAGAAAYERRTGKKPRWWRAPGNKAPGATLTDLKGGDPPWVFYWGYDTLDGAFATWRATFVPKPRPADTREALEKDREVTANYRLTGFLFWAGDDEWFRALCDAGYKGENTDANPAPSVARYRQIWREVSERWAQARMRNLTVDGDWGPKSKAACKAFQTKAGLVPTGVLDDATLTALAQYTLSLA